MASPTISFQDPWKSSTNLPLRSPERSQSTDTHHDRSPSGTARRVKRPPRSNHLNLSLSPSVSSHRATSHARSPPKSTGARSIASVTSPTASRRKTPIFDLTAPSPDQQRAPSVVFAGQSSREPSLAMSEVHEDSRATSAETVRGQPAGARSTTTPPLTPFPPWISDSEGEDGDGDGERASERDWLEGGDVRAGDGRPLIKGHHAEYARGASLAMRVVDSMWMFNSLMHGVLLSLQCLVALGVFSGLAWVTVWKKSDSDAQFMGWLWAYAEPAVGMVLVMSSATLIAHEIKVLSAVVLLYLQSAILVVTTVASLVLWMRFLEENNPMVKGVLMGCNLLMGGLAFFSFVRTVVLWKVEAEMDWRRRTGLLGAGVVSYGTFVPWDEVAAGRRDEQAYM